MTHQKETKRLTTILFVRNYPPDDPRPAGWSLFLTYDTDAEPYWDFQHAAGQVGPHISERCRAKEVPSVR